MKTHTSDHVRPGTKVSFKGGTGRGEDKRIWGTVNGQMVDYYVPVYVSETDQCVMVHLDNILTARRD